MSQVSRAVLVAPTTRAVVAVAVAYTVLAALGPGGAPPATTSVVAPEAWFSPGAVVTSATGAGAAVPVFDAVVELARLRDYLATRQ